jgi:hypothetical protein
VGYYTSGGAITGFSTDASGNLVLIVPGATVKGINNFGQIVGYFGNSGFVDTASTITPINVDEATFTQVTGINDIGQIVGFYGTSSGEHSFLANAPAPFVANSTGTGFHSALDDLFSVYIFNNTTSQYLSIVPAELALAIANQLPGAPTPLPPITSNSLLSLIEDLESWLELLFDVEGLSFVCPIPSAPLCGLDLSGATSKKFMASAPAFDLFSFSFALIGPISGINKLHVGQPIVTNIAVLGVTPSFVVSTISNVTGNGDLGTVTFNAVGVSAVFAGTPGQSNCHGESVSPLTQQFGGLDAAATALGYPSVQALQAAIRTFCRG